MKQIIIVFTLFFSSCGLGNKECLTETMKKLYLPLQIKGIVIDKYEDKENRGFPKIHIKQGDSIFVYPFDMDLDYTFYKEVCAGDSVYKECGSLNFKMVRDTNTQIFKNKCLDSTFYDIG